MGETCSMHGVIHEFEIFVGKRSVNRLLGKQEDNIKTDL
jgi:hypothetical protein